MAVPITIAKVGWGTEPVELVEWKANEGDRVDRDSTILAVTTKKIESDIHAAVAGYLHIVVPEGNKAPIGSVVGLISETSEELQTLQKERPTEPAARVTEPQDAPTIETGPAPIVARTFEEERIRISPVASKMAEEHMIDIASIAGTGPGGRIVREDIERAIEVKKEVKAPSALYQGKRVKSIVPLRGMRAAIAENMYHSLSTSAQLTVMGEIDMTEVVKLRETILKQAETIGVSITYTDLFVFFVARILRDHPIVNSSLIDNEIRLWEDINIGVAVALEEGLIVPVVKKAVNKSLVEISQTIRTLATKARDGKMVPDDVTGGTFTITNLGALGGGYRFETVITNQQESAILGTGGITDRVVARDKQIVIRPLMTYYFTYDHRVINGAVAAGFMAGLTRLLENPYLLFDWKKIIP
jgi:pyruvate dehydrogenase E2 component (dihydrolipoamide acetyltransferase)